VSDDEDDARRFALLSAALEPEWCPHGYRRGSCLECGDYGPEALARWEARR
jgi:hypothetical protein